MLAVPAGQPFLLASTLPVASLASIEICAAAGSAQWLTSWPFRLRRPPLEAILKSCTAKSFGEQAACAAIGASRNRAEASRIFMADSVAVGMSIGGDTLGNRPLPGNL